MTTSELLANPGNRVIVGTQFGDEGKGKAANSCNTDIFGRGQGSDNAGHTFVSEQGEEINTHLLPSGVTIPGKMNIIGHDTFINPISLAEEISHLRNAGYPISPSNLRISGKGHVVMPHHVQRDSLRENGAECQGTTKRGVAFVAADKMLREGLRMVSLVNEDPADLRKKAYEGMRSWIISDQNEHNLDIVRLAGREQAEERASAFIAACEFLKPYIDNTDALVQERLAAGQTITAEGAQAFGLDISMGKYPFVTSSNTMVMGLASGLGLTHKQIDLAIGAAKAIQSKVGGGKMVTAETDPRMIDVLRGRFGDIDAEYGKTSKRARDVGYLDLVLVRAAARANALDLISVSKIDVLRRCDTLKACVAYMLDGVEITELPEDANEIDRCTPVYEQFDPFTQDVRGETDYSKLPASLRRFIEFSEEYVGVPFGILGTGPANHEVIIR